MMVCEPESRFDADQDSPTAWNELKEIEAEIQEKRQMGLLEPVPTAVSEKGTLAFAMSMDSCRCSGLGRSETSTTTITLAVPRQAPDQVLLTL